jgi:hypothetical protein
MKLLEVAVGDAGREETEEDQQHEDLECAEEEGEGRS